MFIVVRTDIDVMVTGIVKDQLVVFFCSTFRVGVGVANNQKLAVLLS